MNHAFNRLDDGKATLRLLYMLYGECALASRGELEEILSRNGVGRSAFYSSLNDLRELGFIVEVRKRVRDKNLVLTELTEKGEKIVKVIDEIHTVIEQEFQE